MRLRYVQCMCELIGSVKSHIKSFNWVNNVYACILEFTLNHFRVVVLLSLFRCISKMLNSQVNN